MDQYLDTLERIYNKGEKTADRTGTGTISLFGPCQIHHDMAFGFPLLTTKKMFFRGIKTEFIWFLRGYTNIKYMTDRDVHIWDEWADEEGELGPVYGKQLRDWENPDGENIDALHQLYEGLRHNPHSRRHVTTLWNLSDLENMRLPPCHGITIQFKRRARDGDKDKLDLKMYQRSADFFLGVPFNIASYGLFLKVMCNQLGCRPGTLTLTFGDAHIYLNHTDQVEKQLSREPFELPFVNLDVEEGYTEWNEFEPDDFLLECYKHHPKISAPISV